MYTAPQKQFSLKPEKTLILEIEAIANLYPDTRRIFLADGDALVLSTRRLLTILQSIKHNFPKVTRIASYCLPRNVKAKSIAQLKELNDAGLGLVYVGAETGDDHLLKLIDKGETFLSTVEALQKLKTAGIKTSVMILNGLGGKPFSQQHALNSARLVNETQPNYLATLVISFPMGTERFLGHFAADFELLDQRGLFQEMKQFIENTELESSIFRSDHASNYLILKGVLGKDKQPILDKIHQALETPHKVHLRPEWQRGL
jgi:radical SAM superfamily enzyme YgiQ (UPF0313 family)